MATEQISLGLQGAAGRMGLRLIQLVAEDPTVRLGWAVERPGHPSLGSEVGLLAGVAPLGIRLTTLGDLEGRVDAMIDFSHPAATLELAKFCQDRAIPLVVGTTGLSVSQRAELDQAAATIPLLVSPNMSRAVNLLMHLVAEATRALGQAADIEIIERHHRMKKDAPSGTALRLAEIAAGAARISHLVHGREGLVGERPRDEIGLHAVRAGDAPGEHTVIFGLPGESLELCHRAYNRDGFVRGAIDAARFLARKPPGHYRISDLSFG